MRLMPRFVRSAALIGLLAGAVAMADASAAPPEASVDEVRGAITGLSSVKDYERLRWVLNAIESQEPAEQPALFSELDEQLDRLTEAQIVPAAVVSDAPSGCAEALHAQEIAPLSEELARQLAAASENADANPQAKEDDLRLVAQLEGEVEAANLSEDDSARQRQMDALYLQIAQVRDPHQQEQLVAQLRRRDQDIVDSKLEGFRNRIMADMAEPETDGSASP